MDVAHQAPLSMGFPRQGYWSELPFPAPGDLPDPGIEPVSPPSPALQVDSLSLSHQGSPWGQLPRFQFHFYPFPSCATLGKLLDFSEPQFPYIVFIFYILKYVFVWLAVPGLHCGRIFSAACELLVVAFGI